jgi:phosphatidylglycerol:prolipoprotein diacylglycerol transferase
MHPFIDLNILPVRIPFYGLMLGISFLCGYGFARRQLIRRYQIPAGPVDLFLSCLILGGFFGSRLFSILFEMSVPLEKVPSYLFGYQSSSVTFFGGFLVDVLVLMIFIRKYRMNFWDMADTLCLPVAFGLALTRIGCFMAGCCWGKPGGGPWAVVFSHPEAITPDKHIPLHPVQLYHSLSNLLIFIILFTLFIKFRTRPRGFLFTLFMLLYPLGRFITEYFRGDAARGFLFDTFSTSQFISILVFTGGLIKLADILRSARAPAGRRT